MSYFSGKPRQDETVEMLKLQSLKIWKVCLSYGLADTVYM